jgi:methyl-accepting chemotaxis protein
MILLCVTIAFAIWELDETAVTTAQFSRDILVFSGLVFIVFIIMSLSLNLLVEMSILRPIKDMIGIARKVRKGHLHQKVRVVTNDELGIMGDGMNAMTAAPRPVSGPGNSANASAAKLSENRWSRYCRAKPVLR